MKAEKSSCIACHGDLNWILTEQTDAVSIMCEHKWSSSYSTYRIAKQSNSNYIATWLLYVSLHFSERRRKKYRVY